MNKDGYKMNIKESATRVFLLLTSFPEMVIRSMWYRVGVFDSCILHFNVWMTFFLSHCCSSVCTFFSPHLIDDSDSLRNHDGSALFYEHNDLFHQLQFKASVALIFTGRYSTRLWCYAVVYYSNVGGDTAGCWIGLYKSESEASGSSSYWLDGNPSTFRNWQDGEPNSTEQCVYIKNGMFYDGFCSERLHYICKGICFCY